VTEEHRRESRASWSINEVAASGLVLLMILAAYVYFSG
jgi:solute:Na+ symporter, SSS family